MLGWEAFTSILSALRRWAFSHSSTLVLVTASDASHEKSLEQLLGSIVKFRKNARVIVFDLGMTDQARMRLEPRKNLKILDYEFENLPDWMHMRNLSGGYAWKPMCIQMAVDLVEGDQTLPDTLIWLDAGCVLTSSVPILEALAFQHGIFANQASGTIREWTVPKALETFEEILGTSIEPEVYSRNQISAACLAFNLKKPWVIDVLARWSEMASVRNAIAPGGADKSNHRFDQALISLISSDRQA